jgi:hypothetical protein
MSNINKKYTYNCETRDKDAIYVGRDKHGEPWYKLYFNKMTGAPCAAWEVNYPEQMAKARKKFLCTKSGKVGSLKENTTSCNTETITADNGDLFRIRILSAETVQLFKTREHNARSATPRTCQRSRAILATFIEPLQEDIGGEDVDLHHKLDSGVTKDELTVEQAADISIVSWLNPGKHRLITINQTQDRSEKKKEMKKDYDNLSGNRNVMNDGLLKLIKDMEESKTEGTYMCAITKTKCDLSDYATNHLKTLIEINN